ncbi:pyridoxamine 5'-phosphate oxidase [Nocardioides daphniae]|uniref:Pyridoxine/pyridoxamine 5'-phosphate oxidase n=1 Tax=Nocardioides daphniae TaxID=402297 RepID=A0A4P7UHS9_9ACTN|nr:pyridoxamine 5'-phosphate oxidase [Nocardioides daphniae]QCC78179.1 pyridoxamine 5'-phosphate oxidase [Nocardioides daphniae]GGD21241.1 pyridoxine/pyridoxamine 5'-phosphate oxidase [Nocardioides daphniae]
MEHEVDLAHLRREYAETGLDEVDAADDAMVQFRRWWDDAVASGLHEPNAMVVATVSPDGRPTLRTVLMKGFDGRGFTFFTNQASRKGADLAANPACGLLFPWHPLQRQVRVEGTATRLEAAEVEAYFRQRPRGAQVGAWASPQSQSIGSREDLEAAYAREDARFGPDAEVPVPPTWGGYRVAPESIEFWQGRYARLHDRLLYTRTEQGWERIRLAP